MNDRIEAEEYIVRFNQWLPDNASHIKKFIRQVNAVFYFITMISIGIFIFILEGIALNIMVKLICTGLIITLFLFTKKISYFIADADSFMEDPLIIDGLKDNNISKLSYFISENDHLNKSRSISKMISNSNTNKFDLYHYLNGMILINSTMVALKNKTRKNNKSEYLTN